MRRAMAGVPYHYACKISMKICSVSARIHLALDSAVGVAGKDLRPPWEPSGVIRKLMRRVGTRVIQLRTRREIYLQSEIIKPPRRQGRQAKWPI